MRALRIAIVVAMVASSLGLTPARGAQRGPRTGFEERNGESWTTHEEELDFLAKVDRLSARAHVDRVGTSVQKRPIHLVRVGHPRPPSTGKVRRGRAVLFVCSQHGNEPAGRETCLQLLRDLAFTNDAKLMRQLRSTTMLFVPAANPDGRDANTRGNATGVDINRDHLTLATPEARAVHKVVRAFRPDVVLDLHEYGPSVPVLYDDEILYLWSRNLNVDPQVHALAKTLAIEYIGKGVERAGYSSDEYGLYAVGDQDVAQTAGNHDEGIARNAMGLRHALGILIESAVTSDARNGPGEVTTQAEVNLRRVASQMQATLETLRFMREQGELAEVATEGAFARAVRQGRARSRPVYFGGADNDPPEEGEVQNPPPCGYRLTAQDAKKLKTTLSLHGIAARRDGKRRYVPMGQSARPVIPLLLDARGSRHAAEGSPVMRCRR